MKADALDPCLSPADFHDVAAERECCSGVPCVSASRGRLCSQEVVNHCAALRGKLDGASGLPARTRQESKGPLIRCKPIGKDGLAFQRMPNLRE